MKTAKEIEKLAFDTILSEQGKLGFVFVVGYNCCQKDISKEFYDKQYTEEDLLKCWNTAFTDAMNISEEDYKPIWFSDFINSLNKNNE
jgi:hypothetical protein